MQEELQFSLHDSHIAVYIRHFEQARDKILSKYRKLQKNQEL